MLDLEGTQCNVFEVRKDPQRRSGLQSFISLHTFSVMLNGTLQEDTELFNRTWGQRDADAPVLEFLIAAAHGAYKMSDGLFRILLQQVSKLTNISHCMENRIDEWFFVSVVLPQTWI